MVAEIELSPEHSECLDAVEGSSHIVVVFDIRRVSWQEREMEKFHRMDLEELPLVRALATRSPRPDSAPGARVPQWVKKLEKSLEGDRQR